MQDVFIAGAARTPNGALLGDLSSVTAAGLGGLAIAGALAQSGVAAADVDEVVLGCVLTAGQGQAPARQAGFKAGLGASIPATTINKMCGSGMKAAMLAYDQIRSGSSGVIVAGGMESMSNAPYLLAKMRAGARMGHAAAIDHMFLDGLEDAYETGRLMGTFAEDCATQFQLSRRAQDEFALGSLANALAAQKAGGFDAEIVPVVIKTRGGEQKIVADEGPGKARPDKVPTLKPAFRDNGTVTAANASSISDGAAALVLASGERAEALGLPRRARILGHHSHAHEPALFPSAPVPAARKLLEQLGWSAADVDLWEVNEAFAVVPMIFMRELGVPRDKLNVNGGACALGHPIGASGARIIVTLLHALEARGLKRGMAAVCIGGGEATAIAIERT